MFKAVSQLYKEWGHSIYKIHSPRFPSEGRRRKAEFGLMVCKFNSNEYYDEITWKPCSHSVVEIYYLGVRVTMLLKQLTSKRSFWKVSHRTWVDSLSLDDVSMHVSIEVVWLASTLDGLVLSKHSESHPAVVAWVLSGFASAEFPFAYSTLSKNISNSQCLVWGKRSTAIALTGRKEAPLTRLEGARQRLDGKREQELY